MKIFLIIAAAAAIIASCNSQTSNNSVTVTDTSNNTSAIGSALTEDTGWIALFDGKTLNGWHTFGSSSADLGWDVDSGAIHRNASAKEKFHITKNDDILTDGEYDNFDLKLEWKVKRDTKGANGGIMFHVNEDTSKFKETYWTGPEMQVRESAKGDNDNPVKHNTGDLYDLIASQQKADKPAGEWNQVEIMCNGNKLDFYLNGVHIVSTTMWDDNWNKMVAKSKFNEWPAFGTFKTGHISFQNELSDVWYRNVMIKKL